MARASRELAITHLAQHPAQRLLGDDDAEFLENPLAEIDDTPAHDPVNRWNWAALDDRGERRPMRVVKPGWLSRRLAVDQALRPLGVELQHPVANDLERHPADPGRLRAPRAFVNRRQSQKPPRLRPVLRSPCRRPHHLRIKISPERNGHGEPPSFATLNHNPADSGIPNRVNPSEIRYKRAQAAATRAGTRQNSSCCRGLRGSPSESSPQSWSSLRSRRGARSRSGFGFRRQRF